MRYIYIVVLCVLSSGFSLAQNKNAGKDKVAAGNKLLAKKAYSGALHCFMSAYTLDSSVANTAYKIGLCLFNIGNREKEALGYFQKATHDVSGQYNATSVKQQSASPLTYYYMGILYQETYHFKEAVAMLKKFKTYTNPELKPYLANVGHLIKQCQNAAMYVMAPSNAKVTNMGDSINSLYSDYGPMLQQDGTVIIFTSRRPTSKNASVMPDGQFANHIYISHLNEPATWSAPTVYDKNLNSFGNDICSSITADGQQMLLYATDARGGGALYISHMGDTSWNVPEKLGSDINTVGTPSNACLLPDGNTLYFVSERPGGMGGKDIWRCVKLPNGEWSRALNLGAPVNSPYNEETPYMFADGQTFFFSSQGHESMGGYDIFFSQVLDSGKFSEPFNLGYPINTPFDETHFSLSQDGKIGYFNSNRSGGKGKEDIYTVIMPHPTERPLTVIKGQILPASGQSLPDDLHVVATDSATNEEVGDFKPVKATGKFTVIVPPGRTYTLSYQSNYKEFYKEIIRVPLQAGYKEIHKALTLSPYSIKSDVNDTISSAPDNSQ